MDPKLTQARDLVRDLSHKALTVCDDTSLNTARKSKQLDYIDGQLKAALAEVKSLEYVEAQRNALYAAVGDPGSAYGGPGAALRGNVPLMAGRKQLGAAPPLALSEDQLRGLHDAVLSHKSLKIEVGTKDASGQLPAQLAPGILGLPHEPVRIADLLPSTAMSAPSIEYIRHVSTTGTAGMVAPGALKPNVTLNVDKITATARKIAVVTTINDEDLEDFSSFASYVSAELQRLIIDEENAQIIAGDGTGQNLQGFLSVPGILTRAAAGDLETGIDTIELAATDVRTGPAYGTVTVWCMNPTTWSAMRRTKDSLGRFMIGDPASGDARRLWDAPVTTTTSMPVGTALGLAAPIAGALHWRSGLSVQTDFGQTGFEHNQTSFRCEQRLALEIAKPAAVVAVTGL